MCSHASRTETHSSRMSLRCRAHGTRKVCVPATLSYYTSLAVFVTSTCIVTSPFSICVDPLSFIIHYSAVFIARSVIMGCVRYRSAEFPPTYFHRAGNKRKERRGGKRGARRKATMNVTNRVWKFWRPNFFLFFFFLALLLCSILLNYRVPTKIKLANCPFIRRARTLLKYSCGSNNKPARCVPPGNLAECIRSIDYPG